MSILHVRLKVKVVSAISGIGSIGIGEYLSIGIGIGIGGNFGIGAALVICETVVFNKVYKLMILFFKCF